MIKMKPLLKESTWTNRKFGESLPTLEDYMGESYNDEDCGDGHAVVSEADPTNDDDKYVSVGWGKYKEKGKEDDENAPTFSKTDSGQFVKAGGDEKGGDAPEKEPAGKLGGGDFERDFEDDEDDYDMGVVPGSRELDDTPEDDSEKGSSLTGAPGRDFEDDPDDIDNLDTALDGSEPEDKPFGGDTGADPDPKVPAPDSRSDTGKPRVHVNPHDDRFGQDADDTTGGDPDDSWDDEEGRAKPSGGDFTKSADYDMWSDDDELAISGTDSDDPAGGKGDAWMTGDDAKQKGMDRASGLANKGMEKRPGGKQAEIDYQKADQMIKKYAGRDIEKAEFWAKKKKQAADAMMGEITIDGKKYKPITESINPTVYDPNKEIKRTWNKIKTRQFDRKWKKEII